MNIELSISQSAFYMKKNIFLLFFISFTLSIWAQNQQDFNLLTQASLTKKWRHGFSSSISTRAFFMENASELSSVFLEAGLAYKISKNWKTAVCYRFREARNKQNFFEEQYRWYIDLAYQTPNWHNFSLSWRGRFQHQDYGQAFQNDGYKSPKELIRNKFSLQYRYNWYWSGYVAEEIFTSPQLQTLPSHRSSVGLSYRANVHHEISTFFQQRQPTKFPRTTQFVWGLGYEWTL